MIDMPDISSSQRKMMDLLQISVVETLIEGLRDGELKVDDEIIHAYMPCIFALNVQIDLIKAIGLIHFNGDKNSQLIVNDFCGLLKDLTEKGKDERER